MVENMRCIVLQILFCGKSTLTAELLDGTVVDVIRDGVLNRSKPSLIEEIREELDSLRKFNVFDDPMAEWMFAKGVVEKALLNTEHLNDAALLHTAAVLYSNLLLYYPVWLDMLRIVKTRPAIVQQSPVVQSSPEEDRKAELVRMVKTRFGLNPASAEISAEELAEELLQQEIALQRGT